MTVRDLCGSRVVVWGGGLEARAVLRRLLQDGATQVSVAIDQPGKRGNEDADACRATGVAVHLGSDARRALLGAEFVVASPSIPPSNPLWAALEVGGIAVETTSNLWMAEFGTRTLAVTGSKGKSTTTSVVAHLMRSAGVRVSVGGNIGVAFHELPTDAEAYVVEIGSNQCARLSNSPRVGVITALFPEHLDWHGDMERYVAAKRSLVEHGARALVTVDSALALLGSLPPGLRIVTVPEPRVTTHSDRLESLDREWTLPSSLLSPHNSTNALLALQSIHEFDPRIAAALDADALLGFQGLPHRLQVVSKANQSTWVDDSLATSPHPTLAALACFSDVPVTLILGGLDRGVDYTPLVQGIAARSQDTAILTVPDNGREIGRMIRASLPSVAVSDCTSIAQAVRRAWWLHSRGRAVLFSPAAPSGAAHRDYEERSDEFLQAIDSMARSHEDIEFR